MPSVINAGGEAASVLISLPSAHFIKWLPPVFLICPIVPESITPTRPDVFIHQLAEPRARVAQSAPTLKFVYPVKKWLTAESYANASNPHFLRSSLAEVMIWLWHGQRLASATPALAGPWPEGPGSPGARREKAQPDHFPGASPSCMGVYHRTAWLPL